MAGEPPPIRRRVFDRTAYLLCGASGVLSVALGVCTHLALRTNAFDLSVFDYALWSTASGGGIAYVPLLGHSLFAEHWMPTLLLLAPLARVWSTPLYLVVLQGLFFTAAAILLYRLAVREVPGLLALALTCAFLFSRRSQSALGSYFYIESAIPLLVFGALTAWRSRRTVLYWVLVVLALGCKEDVAVYFCAFGVLLLVAGVDRRLGAATAALSIAWVGIAMLIVIPYWRDLYGLPNANGFVEGRYGLDASAGATDVAARVLSSRSLARLITLTSATGFLCLLAPRWMLVVLAGAAVDLAAIPGSGQSGLNGHYMWALFPWLFAAAIQGAARIPVRARTAAAVAVVLIAIADTSLPSTIASAPWRSARAAANARAQLASLPLDGSVTMQPNLVPHLPRRRDNIRGAGVDEGARPPDWVVLTTVGNLWPLDAASVSSRVERLRQDQSYREISSGPIVAFQRR